MLSKSIPRQILGSWQIVLVFGLAPLGVADMVCVRRRRFSAPVASDRLGKVGADGFDCLGVQVEVRAVECVERLLK